MSSMSWELDRDRSGRICERTASQGTLSQGVPDDELYSDEGRSAQEDELEEESSSSRSLNQEVVDYFVERRINDLFEFMCNQLIVNEPDDPIEFLKQLMDKLLIYRKGRLSCIPSVFEENHVKAVFNSFDRMKKGTITQAMYHKAMEILKIDYFEDTTSLEADCDVSLETFMKIVRKAQAQDILDMILMPLRNESIQKDAWIYPFGRVDFKRESLRH